MENTEENIEKIWKIRKKPKWNSEKIGKIWKKLWNDVENTEENCEMIWKIWKKIVKRYGKYGRKVSWNVKWFGKYRWK